jgi:hypothetical protein
MNITDCDIAGRAARFQMGSDRPSSRGGDRPKSAPSASLIVKSLAYAVTDDSLAGHFEGCVGARVLMDRESGQSRG